VIEYSVNAKNIDCEKRQVSARKFKISAKIIGTTSLARCNDNMSKLANFEKFRREIKAFITSDIKQKKSVVKK